MYIDIFLVVFVLIGVIRGFHRGVIRTLFSILGLVIGFVAALKFGPYVVTFVEQVFSLGPLISLIVGLLLTFLALMLGIRWLGKSFENTLKLVKLNIFNKVLGAALFACLMIVLYSAVIWFVSRANMISEQQKADSRSYPFLQAVPAKTALAVEHVKPVFKEFWEKIDEVAVGENPKQDIKEQ